MATTDRLEGTDIGVAVKPACTVASTGALTLSAAQTVDGIAVGNGERVLVKDQALATENGIYVSDPSGSWSRSKDMNGNRDAIPGTLVYVDRGATHADTFWVTNSSSTATKVKIGTDDIVYSQSGTNFIKTATQTLDLSSSLTLFSGFPTGVKEFMIGFSQGSLDSTGNIFVQIGDSAGLKSAGYVASGGLALNSSNTIVRNSTAAFIITTGNAGLSFSGIMTLMLMSSDTWISEHSGKSQTVWANFGGGTFVGGLDGSATQIGITTDTGSYDLGVASVLAKY